MEPIPSSRRLEKRNRAGRAPRSIPGSAVATLVLVLAACSGGSADDPVGTTRAFLSAVRRGDCDAAWGFFSRATQVNVAAEVKRMIRQSPVPESQTPQTRYCTGTYGDAKPRSARLVQQQAESAVVSVMFSEGTHLALIPFLSTPYKEWRDSIQLVREDGRWKIQRPLVEVGRQGWKLVEVGEIEVAYALHGDPRRRWVQAEGVIRAPRDAVEATMMDPAAWPRFLPLLQEAQPLEGPDAAGTSIWLLRFRTEGGAVADVPVRVQPYGRLRDPKLPWTKLQWVREPAARHPNNSPPPPLFTGSWELRPRYDGISATFSLVIQPDEWSEEFPSQFLLAANAAAAVASLERAAFARAATSTR